MSELQNESYYFQNLCNPELFSQNIDNLLEDAVLSVGDVRYQKYDKILAMANYLDKSSNTQVRYRDIVIRKATAIAKKENQEELWEYPEEFKKHEIECKFPVDAMPDVLKNYLISVCANLKISHEQAALPLLSALALCLQGKAVIESPETSSYAEQLCLFTLTVAPSGERKSSTFKAFTKPITDYVNDYNDRNQNRLVANKAKRDYIQAQLETAKKAKNNEIRTLELAAQLHDIKELYPLIMFVQNTTVEALKKEMVHQSGRIGIMSGEAGTMDVIAGMYNGGNANIDDILDAYDGTAGTSLRSSENTSLRSAYLSICLLTQPDHFEKIFKKNKVFEGRGMLERFLVSFPERNHQARAMFEAPDIPQNIAKEYGELIHKLLSLNVADENNLPRIKHSHESKLAFSRFYYTLEDKMKECKKTHNTSELSFLSKQLGRTLRIAGILHMCEHSASDLLSGGTAMNAINIAMWAENERKKGLSTEYSEIPEERNAQRLLERIKKSKKSQLNGNDIAQMCRWCEAKDRTAALELLDDMGYIRIEEIKQQRGRTKTIIHTNPIIFFCTEK